MKTILVTAFEPFGGRTENASAEAMNRLPDRIGEYSVRKMLLPVVFGKAAEKVPEEDFSCIFLLGEAGRDLVTPEATARNFRDARIPDNEGHQPRNEKAVPDGPDFYHTSIPARDIAARMKGEGYAIAVSEDAGSFVCNDTFYLVGMKTEVPVEFIHVPATDGNAETVLRFIQLALENVCIEKQQRHNT